MKKSQTKITERDDKELNSTTQGLIEPGVDLDLEYYWG
jgi:hypothetical protein